LYTITVISTSAIKQKRAALLIHLSAAFLLLGNAYIAFTSTANPGLVFIVVQIAASIMILSKVLTGDALYKNTLLAHNIFRLIEMTCFMYAAYYFMNSLHLQMMSTLEILSASGLLYLFFSEQKIYKNQAIVLDDTGILFPAAEKRKKLVWSDIENMRIRNDFVSINTKHNRFIQYETGFVYADAALDEMNAWCFRHITPNATPLHKND
jgi:hypothetical protein